MIYNEGNLPTWKGASKAYSKAYTILQNMANRQYIGRKGKRFVCDGPSLDAKRLIEALNLGDEEKIKGLLLMTHIYY